MRSGECGRAGNTPSAVEPHRRRGCNQFCGNPGVVPAQASKQNPVPSEAQRKIIVDSNLVVLPVTVKDKNGNLIPGLEPKDFRVFDDDAEQTIDVFTAETSPLSVVLLVDDERRGTDGAEPAPSPRESA